jgi:hypothetical protein
MGVVMYHGISLLHVAIAIVLAGLAVCAQLVCIRLWTAELTRPARAAHEPPP